MAVTNEIIPGQASEFKLFDVQPEEKNMAGARHSVIGTKLVIRLGRFVEEHNLGVICGPDATYLIGNQDRLPDLSFVRLSRIPEDGPPEGKWLSAPDLAVEIISPNDLFLKVYQKINEYFGAGVSKVWVVTPDFRTITVFSSPVQAVILTEADELTCEDLLPGFRCRISELFQSPGRT